MREVQEVHFGHALTRDILVNFVEIAVNFGFDFCVSPVVGDDQHAVMEHPLDVPNGTQFVEGMGFSGAACDSVINTVDDGICAGGSDARTERTVTASRHGTGCSGCEDKVIVQVTRGRVGQGQVSTEGRVTLDVAFIQVAVVAKRGTEDVRTDDGQGQDGNQQGRHQFTGTKLSFHS